MYELLNVQVKDGKQLVSGRELHEFLEVGRDFTSWVKGRIAEYGFIENVDYSTIWSNTKTGAVVEFNGNVKSMIAKGFSIDYALTLDMAKELAMVEKNERGKEARRYFIQCEKLVSSISSYYNELINNFKADIGLQIAELKEQGKENHRPSHKTKLDFNNAIKSYAVCSGDESILKQMTLEHFNASKWEDISYDKKIEVLKYIRYLAENLGMFVQIRLSDI